ncbi:MAG: hypothetical protein KC502_08335 [Myxococcales bacterium]|nr:hypothetical protein [Myxococcales bacterium]
MSVSLGAIPKPSAPAQAEVRGNVRATKLALRLEDAWRASAGGNNFLALPALRQAELAAKSTADRQMVQGLKQLIVGNRAAPKAKQRAIRDALRMACDRKIGDAGQ